MWVGTTIIFSLLNRNQEDIVIYQLRVAWDQQWSSYQGVNSSSSWYIYLKTLGYEDQDSLLTYISGASFGVGGTVAFCLPISLYTQHLCVISLGFLKVWWSQGIYTSFLELEKKHFRKPGHQLKILALKVTGYLFCHVVLYKRKIQGWPTFKWRELYYDIVLEGIVPE